VLGVPAFMGPHDYLPTTTQRLVRWPSSAIATGKALRWQGRHHRQTNQSQQLVHNRWCGAARGFEGAMDLGSSMDVTIPMGWETQVDGVALSSWALVSGG
jgi:hypothetical protein